MTPAQLEIQLIAVVVAVACALPGVFLVLRRMSLMSDAIAHAILLGIVLGFFVTNDTSSPVLILGAAAVGVLTVTLVEAVKGTRLVREDAAIGLVFPALFSVGVILISRYASDVHLDTDAVLLGELAFAPFERFVVAGWDLGPKSLWVMTGILTVSVVLLIAFYKELKITTFDPALAAALGISPLLFHYGVMTTVSTTVVGAFDAVGSILVVALMIAPPATAHLLTDRLSRMILLSAGLGAVSAISGFWVAHLFDASIAGSMASMTGLLFLLAWLFSPERGLVASARRRRRQRFAFARTMLAIHLFNHEGLPEAARESRVEHLDESLRWDTAFLNRVVEGAARGGLITEHGGALALTEKGRAAARAGVEL